MGIVETQEMVVTLQAMPLIALCAMFAVLACVLAGYACHRAINAEIIVKALENSTHKIQYVPVDVPGVTDEGPTPEQEAVIDEQLAKHDREAMARLNMEVEPLD